MLSDSEFGDFTDFNTPTSPPKKAAALIDLLGDDLPIAQQPSSTGLFSSNSFFNASAEEDDDDFGDFVDASPIEGELVVTNPVTHSQDLFFSLDGLSTGNNADTSSSLKSVIRLEDPVEISRLKKIITATRAQLEKGRVFIQGITIKIRNAAEKEYLLKGERKLLSYFERLRDLLDFESTILSNNLASLDCGDETEDVNRLAKELSQSANALSLLMNQVGINVTSSSSSAISSSLAMPSEEKKCCSLCHSKIINPTESCFQFGKTFHCLCINIWTHLVDEPLISH